MAVPNNMNPVQQGAPYAPGGGIFPNAGHHNDVQHIWRLVEELSQALQANREKYEELQESITRAQIRPQTQLQQRQENGLVNGDGASHTQAAPTAEAANQIAHLTNRLASAESHIHELQQQAQSQDSLLATYESSVQEITARLRQYAYEQQNNTIALHEHYNRLLEQSRNETVQAQLVHQAWQAGLGRLAEGLREAYRGVNEGGAADKGRIAALRSENATLRKMVGWEEDDDDSSDDDDEDDEGEEGGLAGVRERERIEDLTRGRMGLGLQ